MAKLKTQFNDLVQAPEVVFFENTITMTKNLNDNLIIDLSAYDNYKVIIDADDTTCGGSLTFILPSKVYIEFINISTIDGGYFGTTGVINGSYFIDGVFSGAVTIDSHQLPLAESTDVYMFVEKIGKIINLYVVGQ